MTMNSLYGGDGKNRKHAQHFLWWTRISEFKASVQLMLICCMSDMNEKPCIIYIEAAHSQLKETESHCHEEI